MKQHEVEVLRVEYRRVTGRINYRKRRGLMFAGLLVLTLAVVVSVAVFALSPSDWIGSQQSRFTQMSTLVLALIGATPLAGHFLRRYDRQRERVRIARTRQHEILQRLEYLDNVTGGGRRRRRRRRRHSWAWRVAHPKPFTRPSLESLPPAELEDAAEALGNQLQEERALRAIAYAHAVIFGGIAIVVAFLVTLSGPAYLTSFLGGEQWGGTAGPDPLVFWAALTGCLVAIGGFGAHRVTVLLRRARGYQDRLIAVERALWDARVLLRERREEI